MCITRRTNYEPRPAPKWNTTDSGGGLPMIPCAGPCSNVLLRLSAKNLKNKDVLSKSDPMCVVYQLVGNLTGQPRWVELCRTETIRNDINPAWHKTIEISYLFEQRQTLKFSIYDADSARPTLADHDFLGTVTCDLGEIVSLGSLTRNLQGLRYNRGTLTIVSEQKNEGQREHLLLNVSASNLDKKDWCGLTDAFLDFYRTLPTGQRVMIHRTPVIPRNLNPSWRPFELNVYYLSGGNRNESIIIECWDDDNDNPAKAAISKPGQKSVNDYVGRCEISMAELMSGHVEKRLINERKRRPRNSGILRIQSQVISIPTFLDYIVGGTQLDFTVAIDFTASNGNPTQPNSLHYMGHGVPNQYETAIRAVLEICQHYNGRKVFEAYGFGAIVHPNAHLAAPIFSLGNPMFNFMEPGAVAPTLGGIDGVLFAYRQALNTVRLFGPTNFAPIIERAIVDSAQYSANPGARYKVLLIITDGVINDMHHTKLAICQASRMPISIIIVGVGNADFRAMDELDSDDVVLTVGGHSALRDIVQFVPMRKFLGRGSGGGVDGAVMANLAKEVLFEVPRQLTSYYRSQGIQPRPQENPFPKSMSPAPGAVPPPIGFEQDAMPPTPDLAVYPTNPHETNGRDDQPSNPEHNLQQGMVSSAEQEIQPTQDFQT